MLDFSHLMLRDNDNVAVFTGNSRAAGESWHVWQKPRGKTMVDILLVGKGGDGGTGVIGAASTAAGGGGGASGAMTRLRMPLHMLPDRLYLSLAMRSSALAFSYVALHPSVQPTHMLAQAASGNPGGNASGGTAGVAGAAAAIATVAQMPLGWPYAFAIGGQLGGAGGTSSVTPPALALPATGILVTGGTGGAGLAAAGSAGTSGGVRTGAGRFPSQFNQLNTGVATDPPQNGTGGGVPIPGLMFLYGGTGGNATHGSATGAGLKQASGGNAAPGCGGGGMGGALTGSTAGAVGVGGDAFCIITTW